MAILLRFLVLLVSNSTFPTLPLSRPLPFHTQQQLTTTRSTLLSALHDNSFSTAASAAWSSLKHKQKSHVHTHNTYLLTPLITSNHNKSNNSEQNMDALTSAEPRVTLPPFEPLSPSAVGAITGLGLDVPMSLAKIVQKANLVVSEALSSPAVNTTKATTTPEITDTVKTMAREDEVGQNTDAGVTSQTDHVGPRRSTRIARTIQARSAPTQPAEEAASDALVTTTTAKKRTRGVKVKEKATGTNILESQAWAEDESTPRKRRKETGKERLRRTERTVASICRG